jgi:CRP/FNR family transcriptional regulator, cyclic AMP receptor protein
MAREEYLNHLASVPLFSGCTTKELRDIAKAAVELTLDEGKEFVTQGDVGREAFVIVEGRADVTRGGQTIAQLGPGDCVGELALLDHGPRTASVTAATPLTVLVLGAARRGADPHAQGAGRPGRPRARARRQGVRLAPPGLTPGQASPSNRWVTAGRRWCGDSLPSRAVG